MKVLRVERGVEFRKIPVEMLFMFHAVMKAADAQGVAPTITGAAYNGYPAGKVHDQGYAIDVRVRDVPDPASYAETIRSILGAVSPHYVVLYGDEGHRDHIHIGFAWAFSSEARGG